MKYQAYIKERIVNLDRRNKWIKEQQAKSNEVIQPVLEKLVRLCAKGKITPGEMTERCADITMAFDHGRIEFYEELSRIEDEIDSENEKYQQLSIEDVQDADPININKETKKLIESGDLFE